MGIKNKYIPFGLSSVLILGIGSYLFNNYQDKEEYNGETSYSETTDNSVVYVNTDYLRFDSAEALFESSNSVINGKVLSYKDEIPNIVMTVEEINQLEGLTKEEKEVLIKSSKTPEYFPYRVFDIEITETFKGEHEVGDTIQVKQLYGQIDNSFYDNEFLLNSDYEYILFLEDYPNSPSSLLNQEQSSYLIDNDSINEEILIPVNKANKDIKINKKKVSEMQKNIK